VLPGHCFGRPASELSLRLAYVDFDGEAALEAASAGDPVDTDFLKTYCSRVTIAIDRMASWVQQPAG
jgi:aspartate aminotransferase